MIRFAIAILAVILIVALLTFLLGKGIKKRAYIKYTPSLLLLLSGLYNLYLARTAHNGFEDLARFLLAFLFLIGFVSGTVTGLLMDFLLPRMRRKG